MSAVAQSVTESRSWCVACLLCAARWLLQIEVLDVAAGRLWFFEADCWLDAAQGDGKTERLLLASVTDPLADRRAYRVGHKTICWQCLTVPCCAA